MYWRLCKCVRLSVNRVNGRRCRFPRRTCRIRKAPATRAILTRTTNTRSSRWHTTNTSASSRTSSDVHITSWAVGPRNGITGVCYTLVSTVPQAVACSFLSFQFVVITHSFYMAITVHRRRNVGCKTVAYIGRLRSVSSLNCSSTID